MPETDADRPLLICGATLIDGVAEKPMEGKSILIEKGRIKVIGSSDEMGHSSPPKQHIEARGKYVVPGLMNANVHLLADVRLENLARYLDRFEELISEAAQVALKNGLTTVFDTWGPRRFLMTVRDRINAGEIPGSRIFCAGNIIGFDGPFSLDFIANAHEQASATLVRRINAIWCENVGRHLMWLTPEHVAKEVRTYIGKGIDFIKYGSNEHCGPDAGAFLAFSPEAQAAMVEQARRVGITAQAHTMSVEGLRIAVEAGCDLIQHANITGPVPIPEITFDRMARQKTGAVLFPFTEKALTWIMENSSERQRTMWHASDVNARRFVASGVPILLANDGGLLAPEALADSALAKSWAAIPEEDSLFPLATGHFAWLKAMEQKGMPAMEILRAATRNIAEAYGKSSELGTLEPGKIADLLILDGNPLEAAENYRSIHMVIKDGHIVDRDLLPIMPLLTRPAEPPADEEKAYTPFFPSKGAFAPLCPMCMCR